MEKNEAEQLIEIINQSFTGALSLMVEDGTPLDHVRAAEVQLATYERSCSVQADLSYAGYADELTGGDGAMGFIYRSAQMHLNVATALATAMIAEETIKTMIYAREI